MHRSSQGLSGTLGRRSMIPVLVRLARSVDGVVDVQHRLEFEVDDTDAPRTT